MQVKRNSMDQDGGAIRGAPGPPIALPPVTDARPTLSVVIPTYEPDRFLIDTIGSVLSQDPGTATMQIAIVDDASTRMHTAELLEPFKAGGRIEFYAGDTNLGLAGNWNRAIGLARGHFVHILHQDDMVRPGFYAALLAGLNHSASVGMAFCRHAYIDAANRTQRISHRERWHPGVLPRWLQRIAVTQRIQCPAAIVRRDVYEALGGFRADLSFALDWEMWVRIASRYDVWYEPQVLADYRRHDSTESARLEAAGRTTSDMAAAIELFAAYLPEEDRDELKQKAYGRMVRTHTRRASKLLKAGATDLAMKHIQSAHAVSGCMNDTLVGRWRRWHLMSVEARLPGGMLPVVQDDNSRPT